MSCRRTRGPSAFSNRWYTAALRQAQELAIDGLRLRVVTAPYFIGTEYESEVLCAIARQHAQGYIIKRATESWRNARGRTRVTRP
jgi:hypothetical protein